VVTVPVRPLVPTASTTPVAEGPPLCGGLIATIVGTSGRDVLVGTAGRDVIAGLGADDRVSGRGGGDVICGGDGNDVIDGGPGDDGLTGGAGADTLIGSDGADHLIGGRARDSCLEGSDGGTKAGCEARAFGTAFGIVLFEPSASVVGVGFHESLFSTAQPFVPIGPGLDASAAAAADGVPHVVMVSRGRGTPAASAADVVVGSATPILSPVTGKVVDVIHYLLYCKALDWEIVIQADGRPDARIIMIHIHDPLVHPGGRVIASVTKLGTSWGNDSESAEENRYFPDQYPHFHIEVERGTKAPIPGCLPGDA
jgi:hypothetical protein